MKQPPFIKGLAATLLVTLSNLSGQMSANALTLEEARENCRDTVRRPLVRACMGGQKELREACRAKAQPAMSACVQAALNKANGRANVPIAITDGPKKEIIPRGDALPAGFVPPPRTIADIAAVLDNEKPNPETLAKLKADADREPERGLSNSDLAKFYFERGEARTLLGRFVDAIADGEKALSLVNHGAEPRLKFRIKQFVALRKRDAGDLKSSVSLFEQTIRETQSTRGVGGYAVNARRNLMTTLIQSGDILQAEGHLQRIQAFITEVRTSGNPAKRKNYDITGRSWESDL